MKIRYFPATDSLTIDLKDGVGEPSRAEDLTPDGNVRAVYSSAGELVR